MNAEGRATQEQLPRGLGQVKTPLYIPLIPTFSLKGEGAGTYVDTYAQREKALYAALSASLSMIE